MTSSVLFIVVGCLLTLPVAAQDVHEVMPDVALVTDENVRSRLSMQHVSCIGSPIFSADSHGCWTVPRMEV